MSENELEQLQRELRGTQEMLAHVLLTINEPVKVNFEQITAGIPDNLGIEVFEDMASNQFVFRLVENG